MRELLLKIYAAMQKVLAFEELAMRPVRIWPEREAVPAVLTDMLLEEDLLSGNDCPQSFMLLRAAAQNRDAAEQGFACPEEGILGADTPLMQMAGAALGMKAQESEGVVVAFLGAEAQWDPTFAQALRLISRWNLPVVCLCQPPQPNAERPWEQIDLGAACEQLGMEHVAVDATDAMKLTPVIRCALERAREGDGATIIECQDSYEDEETPAERLRSMLLSEGYATCEELEALANEAREEMRAFWQGEEEENARYI